MDSRLSAIIALRSKTSRLSESFVKDTQNSPDQMTRSLDISSFRHSPPSTFTDTNQNLLQAASTLVPVPESLQSPDVCRPLHPILTPQQPLRPHPLTVSTGRSSLHTSPHTTTPYQFGNVIAANRRDRPGDNKNKIEGASNQTSEEEDTEMPVTAKKVISSSSEKSDLWRAALLIQRRWRGFKTRNLNKTILDGYKTIQTNRHHDYIEKLSEDVEISKQGLEKVKTSQERQSATIQANVDDIEKLKKENFDLRIKLLTLEKQFLAFQEIVSAIRPHLTEATQTCDETKDVGGAERPSNLSLAQPAPQEVSHYASTLANDVLKSLSSGGDDDNANHTDITAQAESLESDSAADDVSKIQIEEDERLEPAK